MARKDILASGGRSAKFAVGGTVIPGAEDNIFRNAMSEEDAARLDAEVLVPVEHVHVVPKVFRPRGSTILVRRVTVEELSTILITESIEKEHPAEGTVLAVGPKVTDVNPDERIVFGKYAGTEFKLNGEILLIMDEEDVKGIIEEASEPELNIGGCIVGRA